MQQLLEAAGYQIVDFEEKADVYIINTCSVTNVADKKSRQMLHRAKAKNPEALVVAAGCYAQAAGEKLLDDTAIDLVIGNNKKAELVQLLEERLAGREPQDAVIDISAAQEYEALHIERQADHTRAFIKVQDGCNQFCSYCIIPLHPGTGQEPPAGGCGRGGQDPGRKGIPGDRLNRHSLKLLWHRL